MVPIFADLVNPTHRLLLGSRRIKVGAGERGKEVIESVLVGQVQRAEFKLGFQLLFMEQVVGAYLCVEKIAIGNARRIMVGIESAGGRNDQTRRTVVAAA